MLITIRHLALEHFCSTTPAPTTRPVERSRCSTVPPVQIIVPLVGVRSPPTLSATTTQPPATLRLRTTPTGLETRQLARMPYLKIPKARLTPPLVWLLSLLTPPATTILQLAG